MKLLLIFVLCSSYVFAQDDSSKIQSLNLALQLKVYELESKINVIDKKVDNLINRVNRLEPEINLTVPQVAVDVKPVQKPVSVQRTAHWSVEGDWNPNRQKVINHLIRHSNHSGKFSYNYLNSLSLEQLKTLHDRDHTYAASVSRCPGGVCPVQRRLRPGRRR